MMVLPFTRFHILGAGWYDFFLSVLLENGLYDTAETVILEKYKREIEFNTPTFGENLFEVPFNSAHGWGACIVSPLIKYFQK